jgi:hypothetical protein
MLGFVPQPNLQLAILKNSNKERRPSYGDFQAGEFSKLNLPTQYNFQDVSFGGGFAGRDYTGNIINQISQLLENESELQALLQQLDNSQLSQLKQIIKTIIDNR